ncbi:MAG: hypothetical protein U1E11_10835 [Dethiobacteria bacterium]|nr:hypothetical protein [Dethiobacteria bacterium]
MAAFWASILLSPAGSNSWAENAQINKRPPGEVSFQRLEGRWVRPDGGYVLELRTIKKDGSVTAAYFNPKPIKVYRAEASLKGGRIHLFVELRDANYPGSTYNLLYDPMSDRLKGTYFQAVERLSFDIEFVRAK